MNAPLLWILVPGLWGVVVWFLRRNQVLSLSLAAAMCFVLGLLAAVVPIGETVNLGSVSFTLPSIQIVLGRRFVLGTADHVILTLIFGFGAVWFGLATIAWPHRLFAPFGMGMLSTLVAALAVEPFLYAALLVEMAVLFSIPFLSPPGRAIGPGLQRYLIFQTLAMPVILFAGWISSVAGANPADTSMFQRAGMLLGLGFAFWLAVFPFYNWLPMMMTETHPFPVGFVLGLLQTAILLLGLDFINSIGFLRSSTALFDVLRVTAVVMVFTAGIWAAFQVNLARLFGYAVIFETGFAFFAVSLNTAEGWSLFASAFLPRLLALLVMAFALASLENRGIPLTLDGVRGLAHRYPILSVGLVVPVLSIAGFPLMAGLPVRLEIFEQLAPISQTAIIAAAVGTAGFLFSGVHLISQLVRSSERVWTMDENWAERIILIAGVIFIILFGIFPETFYHSTLDLLSAFPQLF